MRSLLYSVVVIGCLGLCRTSPAQDSLAVRYAASITADELKHHLTILAGDSFLGRDTGKEGQKMAAGYLKEVFMEAGIPPVTTIEPGMIEEGYFQPYEVIESMTGTISLQHLNTTLLPGKELAYFSEQLRQDLQVDELTYLPNSGTLPRAGVQGKAVVMDLSRFGEGPSALASLRERLEELRTAGAILVLVSVDRIEDIQRTMHLGSSQMRLADPGARTTTAPPPMQTIFVDRTALDSVIAPERIGRLRKRKRSRTMEVIVKVLVSPAEKLLTAENVLGYIEGSSRPEEVVVLTAHYDHIGVEGGVVYNGADDDGSGTVAMIEIAEAFAKAKAAGHGPRRSILVMPVSGEEKGLLGSRYYSEHPVFPLANTVADLNIDMIGRHDSAHAGSPPYVYVIGSDRLSTELHAVNEAANRSYTKLDLDYRFNEENDPNRFYYRSDHYNFARKGVPSIFYFSGVHEDYHQPGDDVDKIQFDLLEQRTKLVFHTAWILANREERIVVDKPLKP